jgi:hypothetical protein
MSGTASSGPPATPLGIGCFFNLLLFVAIGAANDRLLTPTIQDPPLRFGFALTSALLLAVGLSSFWSMARGFGTGGSSRGAILRRVETGERPPDGGAIVATGSVRALSTPLTAPLSGVACVAYMYKMHYVTGSGSDRSEVPVYWGYASRPFALDGPTGRTRVLAVPQLVSDAQVQNSRAAQARAAAYAQTASFEEVEWNVLGALGTAFKMAREIFTDEDGEARHDWHRAGDQTDPSSLVLEETVLPVDDEVSVHGIWSAEREAVVAQGDKSVAAGVSAALGPPASLGSVLPASPGSYLATATVSTLLGAAILWFALKILPHLD